MKSICKEIAKALTMKKTTKHHVKRGIEIEGTLNSQNILTKHHTKKNRSPALIPVPETLVDLLELANLVPVQLRQPYWARRNTEEQRSYWFNDYAREYLRFDWKPDDIESEWGWFHSAIMNLPLALQAFILQDFDFEVFENESGRYPCGIDSDIQVDINFEVLHKTESELIEINKAAHERHEKTFKYEASKSSISPLDRVTHEIKAGNKNYFFVEAEHLLRRARQRLILILAAQETLICLTHPEAWRQVRHYRTISNLYDSQSTFYIIQQGKDKGKLGLRPSALYEPLIGIEANRIRECPICFQIFWAGRKDQVGCTPQCAKVIRTRRWRENATKYESARAEKERLAMTKSKPNQKKKGT